MWRYRDDTWNLDRADRVRDAGRLGVAHSRATSVSARMDRRRRQRIDDPGLTGPAEPEREVVTYEGGPRDGWSDYGDQADRLVAMDPRWYRPIPYRRTKRTTVRSVGQARMRMTVFEFIGDAS